MRRVAVLMLIPMIAGSAYAAVTADSVFSRARANFDGVRDYSARAVMSVDAPTVRIKGSRFKLYYKKPDMVHIKPEGGFAMVPQGTFLGNPFEEIGRDSTMKLSGQAKLNGRDCWLILVSPKAKSPRDAEFTLWIEKARGLILATRSEPAPDARVEVFWDYVRVDGKYWLPSSIEVKMDGLPATMSRERGPFVQSSGKASGTAVIKFSDYRVNKGIPDSVFRRKDGR